MLISITQIHAQNVGIGTTNPTAKLHVNGNVRFADGSEGTDKVLTSDALGNASWQPQSSSNPTSGYGGWNSCESPFLCEYQPFYGDYGQESFFGQDVAISGDYAFVGVPRATIDGVPKGAVHIYQLVGGQWTQIQTLYESSGQTNDYFGASIAVSGNFLVVGVPESNNAANNDGKVNVYKFDGTYWLYHSSLTSTDPDNNEKFGSAVDIHNSTLMVGTSKDRPDGSIDTLGSLTIYQYQVTFDTWLQNAKFFHPLGLANTEFAKSVAVHQNLIVAGAPLDGLSGAAYVFEKLSGVWTYTNYLSHSSITENGRFGDEVDVFGFDISVGAPFASFYNDNDGVVVFYKPDGLLWDIACFKRAKKPQIFGGFGKSIDLSNGYALIGSNTHAELDGDFKGNCSLFKKVGANWNLLETVFDPSGDFFDFAGKVALNGTSKRFIVGAAANNANSGKVYLGKFKE